MNPNFENIYQEQYSKVIRLCLGYVNGDGDLAKDLAQEVFIKVWEHLDSFRNESSISTWIYRITVNTCLMQLRRKTRTVPLKNIEKSEVDDHTEDEVQKEKQLIQLHACISKLFDVDKSVILLELEGLPQKEIAEVTGLTHKSVRVRIHRIKEKLLKCIRHDNI
ncbi:RNA polymerase sigma factor [Paucihalobacter sp.]|uniref:RNA polymerase sigma factor n=1 Tax=Paucihalobacter sp. TaxID=2850405 RepID=UPI003D160B30